MATKIVTSTRKKRSLAKKEDVPQRTSLSSSEMAGPLYKDGELFFSPFDLARYLLAEHKIVNLLQAAMLKKNEIDKENLRHQNEVRKLQVEVAALTADAETKKRDLEALREALQASYPVKFEEITFDDVTGKIMVHGQPVKEER